MKEAFYIFLAGGAGSVLRYGVQLLMHERIHPYHFPWATLTANVAGCFFIGLFYALSARFHLSAEVRLLPKCACCSPPACAEASPPSPPSATRTLPSCTKAIRVRSRSM